MLTFKHLKSLVASNQFGIGNQTDVFAVDDNGALTVAWVVGSGRWADPVEISPPNMFPAGAAVAASNQFGIGNQTDVFAVNNNGALTVSWVVGGGHWAGPVEISPHNMFPAGAAVAASNQFGIGNQTDVLTVDSDGGIVVFWVIGGAHWNGPVGIKSPWLPVISSENVVAIHAILVPTANGDGEILLVGGDNHSYAGNNPGPPVHHDYDHSRRFNCHTKTMIVPPVATPNFDLFCCGHAFLGDGRPLLAGGTAEFPADAAAPHHAHNHFDGHRHSAIYNYLSATLTQAADMNHQPGLATGGGRWYPTLCTLGNGDVFIFQGHPQGDDNRHGNNTPERYQLASGHWILLPAIGTITSDPILYPRLHVLNDGRIFVSSFINGFTQNIKINAFDGTTQNVSPLPDGAYFGFNCPSVMLPLSSSDGYAAKILLCGGATSQIINLSSSSPNWATVLRDGNPTGVPRIHACATLLPTGQVVLTGGADAANDQAGINNPEIYDPVANHWTTLTSPASVLRNYHSSALLMPDGSVWTAGGNSPDQPGTPPTDTQKKIEIYMPPYPAGARPIINSCPASGSFGSTIHVETNNGSIISKVVLMRCGSSTHAFNPDQRAINLDFTLSGNTLNASIPSNPNVVIPGPYMLFTVDNAGRPCQYAKFMVMHS